jgi:hypothetical protein
MRSEIAAGKLAGERKGQRIIRDIDRKIGGSEPIYLETFQPPARDKKRFAKSFPGLD